MMKDLYPKKTLRNIRLEENMRRKQEPITTEQIAQVAGVTYGTAFVVEVGGWIRREDAVKVVRAYVVISGQALHVDQIAVNLFK